MNCAYRIVEDLSAAHGNDKRNAEANHANEAINCYPNSCGYR
jgi:hypothetical protein